MKGRLTIKRAVGESFVVGTEQNPDAVRVTVLRFQGGHVEVQVEAPVELKVMRTELLDRPKDALAHLKRSRA